MERNYLIACLMFQSYDSSIQTLFIPSSLAFASTFQSYDSSIQTSLLNLFVPALNLFQSYDSSIQTGFSLVILWGIELFQSYDSSIQTPFFQRIYAYFNRQALLVFRQPMIVHFTYKSDIFLRIMYHS